MALLAIRRFRWRGTMLQPGDEVVGAAAYGYLGHIIRNRRAVFVIPGKEDEMREALEARKPIPGHLIGARGVFGVRSALRNAASAGEGMGSGPTSALSEPSSPSTDSLEAENDDYTEEALMNLNREKLNKIAKGEFEIEKPEALPNKQAVVDAIFGVE